MAKLVKEALTEEFRTMDWIEKEIEDTMQAYGLSEIEIDKIMNDPDIPEKIREVIRQTNSIRDIEMIALKLMSQAEQEGLIQNEMPVTEEWEGDFPGDSPADQGSRAARKENYAHMEKYDRLNVLEPLAVAIKGVLNRPEDFDPEFIDQITDMWFVVNKEIGKNS